MILAKMINLDENALVCDLAETYNIYNYRDYPANFISVLADGLRPSSRIKMKIAGVNFDLKELLLANIIDNTTLLLWQNTKDGQKNQNKPESLYSYLIGHNKKESGTIGYSSGEEFEKARQELIESLEVR